jgi:hypothetical protein
MNVSAVNISTDISFKDLIDALGKVAGGFKVLANIPKTQREKYRQIVNDMYRLLDTVLNMIILRLGDILAQEDEAFLREAQQLDNFGGWLSVERDLRLCQGLWATAAEMETLQAKLVGKVGVKDWDALVRQVNDILRGERMVADYISQGFRDVADLARKPKRSPRTVRGRVRTFREALLAERQRLIQQEIEFYAIV